MNHSTACDMTGAASTEGPAHGRRRGNSGSGARLTGFAFPAGQKRKMTDIAKLEEDTLRQIAEAADEPALEAVRVAALGKKGAISALLSTLGKMSPE
jgi:hypothetical protein